MSRVLFSQYHKDEARALSARLRNDYYNLIDCLCNCIGTLTEEPVTEEQNELFYSLSKHLVGEIKQEMNYRELLLIPYINELRDKQLKGHNCLHCAGGCQVDHSIHLHQIKAGHQKVKEILYRIHQITNPAPQGTRHLHPKTRILANEIAQLDTTLTELFYIEDAILIPKIMELQSQINADTNR